MNDIEDEDWFEDSESSLARKMDYTLRLKEAILRLHGCESEYAGREEVMETFQDEMVWNGYVEVFRISGHPKATRCYAWSTLTGDDEESTSYVVVLELPPVDSAEAAVRAAIMAEIKSAQEEIEKDSPDR